MPSISFVINTYNRARHLPNTLRSLRTVRGCDVEVVVVNGPSTDRTEEVLREWDGMIKVGHCPEANLSMSRNIGISLASGDVISFIDDDAVPHPTWAERVLRHYGNPSVAGVGGFTVDNTGVRFQVCKTICDRFGNAHNVSHFFDERPLNKPGSFYYPSLLGTNSSFRASALQDIGGFDETFAYLLDETDVCLRLVDAGHHVVYEPEAIIFHQFAPSYIRSARRVARTLYPSAVSKSYFCHRHGAAAAPTRLHEQLQGYETTILRSNAWLADHGEISFEHRYSLDQDLFWGIEKGRDSARDKHGQKHGDLAKDLAPGPFKPLPKSKGLRIVFVSRSFPPYNDAGIARWTKMMAEGLAARGREIHVICEASGEASTSYDGGLWIHRIANDISGEQAEAEEGLPSGMANWAMAVDRAVASIVPFGLDVISFPIWDLEGLRCLRLKDVAVVMSLHTSYALAKPFKPEWNARPIFDALTVGRMIALEAQALRKAPSILANSHAIIRDMRDIYAVDFQERTTLVPHGTHDPMPGRTCIEPALGDPVRVSYVGRFEARKGFDIAVQAVAQALAAGANIAVEFAGDQLNAENRHQLEQLGCGSLVDHSRVTWNGFVDREELDSLYVRSNIVLMPSRYESFGLVAIEAMAAESCVVALAAGGLAEVVSDGENGFTVPPDDQAPRNIAKILQRLESDRPRLKAMQAQARVAYERDYTVERMIDGAERFYLSLVKKGAPVDVDA